MNKDYAEDTLVRPDCLGPIETDEDEVRLMDYLGEIANGTRWIYTESHRIVEAAGLALDLLREKNAELALAKAGMGRDREADRKNGFRDGYNSGYEDGMKAGIRRERREAKKREKPAG